MMETYSLTTRFILTCNYVEKIIPALVSRCQTYKIEPLSKKEVAVHLKNILDKETVQYTPEDLGYIVNTYYPDIRKILNYSQQSVINGKVKISELNSTNVDVKNKIVELLKIRSSTAFNDIRQLIADSDIKHYEEIYEVLFDKVDEYSNGKQTLVILTLAEYIYQSAMVVNREITFMACIAKLLKEAIADAKAVKETAIANAKAALEETFTPYLKEKFRIIHAGRSLCCILSREACAPSRLSPFL